MKFSWLILLLMTLTPHSLVINLYCLYDNEKKEANHPMAVFIPTVRLKRMMTSEKMRDFLLKYNVTSFFPKKQNTGGTALASTAIPIPQPNWFPTAFVVGGSILFFSIVILICICCKKSDKIVEGEEVKPLTTTTQTTTTTTSYKKSPNLSPIRVSGGGGGVCGGNGRNTFSISPKKSSYSFSPNKQVPSIFSFSSPKKYNNEIIYPTTNSVFEMSPPCRVQPQLDLLYPPMRDSANLSLLSSGDEKQRTLLQSRRGSSASLIIDISPRSPVHDYAIAESPTEELLKHKSKLLNYNELRWWKADSKTLYEEFWSIPPNTVSRKNSQMKFSLKNRYPDIIPNARSMVRFDAADNSPVYINANFVSGLNKNVDEYIATQGPLPCTVSDFWLMIWTLNVSVVAMITKLREKHKEKCVQYWPDGDKVTQEKYGDILVTFDNQVKRDGYSVTTLYISHERSKETRQVTHFWYTSWPDHKVPNDTQQILSLIREVQEMRSSDTPVVVHCSAGRGRTGCFIALSMGITQIENENVVDILKIVSHIRLYRGGLVDKVQQYTFLYKALYDYWTLKRGLPITSPSINSSYCCFHESDEPRDPSDSPDSPS